MPNDVNPLSGRPSAPPSATPSARDAQSATFDVVGIRLALSASGGTARLIVSQAGAHDTYAIEPVALAAWAVATTKLLSLQAAVVPAERAEIRAPFLFDRDSRPAIAFEALVSELGVGYRLLVGAAAEPAVGVVTTAELVRGVAQAAAGVATIARTSN
jgi:hypothetical protein